jgi:hypothetical protein
MTRDVLVANAVAHGFTGVEATVRDAIILELLWFIQGGTMTKAQLLQAAYTDGFTGVEPVMRDALILELLFQILSGGGGGGGGNVFGLGANYGFCGAFPSQVLMIKNLDTGLLNRIDTVGADPVVGPKFGDGSTC